MTIRRRDLLLAGTALAGVSACSAAGVRTTAPTTSAMPQSKQPAPTHAAEPWPPEITHGPRTRSAVALTFHGQGDPALVSALLGVLERAGARATVLAVGSWLAAEPQLARRITDAGHDLGNHTQNHRAMTRLSVADVRREIDECAQVLRRLTGTIGTWFRPSQTPRANAVIEAAATRAGYPTCLAYDVDSLDYTDPGAPAIISTTMRLVRPGSIVSMHCGHAGTVKAMPALLGALHARGLRAVTTTELLSP
jgi:peptidoglycan/xylan/chitin deacetylase (PgdA/CDA1 family)